MSNLTRLKNMIQGYEGAVTKQLEVVQMEFPIINPFSARYVGQLQAISAFRKMIEEVEEESET